jgi:hypothetical protein
MWSRRSIRGCWTIASGRFGAELLGDGDDHAPAGHSHVADTQSRMAA